MTSQADETCFEAYCLLGADYVVVAYGEVGRIAKTAVTLARSQGLRIGLLQLINFTPFSERQLAKLVNCARGVLVVEANNGQVFKWVQRVLAGRVPVTLYRCLPEAGNLTNAILAAIHALPIEPLNECRHSAG